MVRYDYHAIDVQGRDQRGQLSAENDVAAARELLRNGLTPLLLQPRRDTADARNSSSATPRPGVRIGAVDRLTVVQELSTLLGAGISLGEALPSLASAYAAQPIGAPLARVGDAVRAGGRLSDALRDSGLGLPGYVQALVEAGEASGELAAALADAAAQMDYERSVNQELRNALVYPGVLVSAGTVAVLIVLIAVVPRFASLLRSSRAEVPLLSKWIIEAGVYLQANLLWVGLCAVAVVGALLIALASPALRGTLLQACTRLPVVGDWLMRMEIGRWATVLARLLGNRVPIIPAINL